MTSMLIVAGEVSGDLHAGNLLAELRELEPGLDAFGVGGERLVEAGLDRLATTEELAHMGLVEVMRELPRIRGIMNSVVAEAARRRPDLAVLVDSPDFNLRLASRLRKLDIPVVLYVSPQLWAWRRRRVRVVRRLAREVLCLLPFEVPFYHQHGVAARYVGHPLVDDIARDGLLDLRPPVTHGRLALLPGSRAMEVRQLLPSMIRAADAMVGDRVSEVVLIQAPGIGHVVDEVLGTERPSSAIRRVAGRGRRRELAACELAWTASGTATIECALLDVPMVVGYRLQPMSYAVARMLVRVPHVALVNLIAEERVVPELIQRDWRVEPLLAHSLELLGGGTRRQRSGLARVRERLGPPGASRRAAEAVLEYR